MTTATTRAATTRAATIVEAAHRTMLRYRSLLADQLNADAGIAPGGDVWLTPSRKEVARYLRKIRASQHTSGTRGTVHGFVEIIEG